MADNLETIQVSLIVRNARKRGYTSSDDFNDMVNEIAHDLTEFNTQWNNRLVPLTAAIPDGTVDSSVDAITNGLSGRHLYTDAASTSTLNTTYYNTSLSRPNTILEQFVSVYNQIQTLQNNLETEIGAIVPTAEQVTISDTGALYNAINVETALAEVMTAVNGVSIDNQTPASAAASGTAGDIVWDTDYIYVCVATDTWKRAALSTWV